MREIKFRAKCIETGEWETGYFSSCEDGMLIQDNVGWGVFINPETVCQYTGLKDRNGKEIYEGDIVKSNLDKNGHIGYSLSNCAFQIFCDDAMEFYFMGTVVAKNIEVVGNIFDNPELIGGDYDGKSG